MRERLSSVFARRDNPYAGVDLANASRFGGALWFLGAAMTALLLPFVHPTQSSAGSAGWAIAGATIVGAVAAGLRMRRVGGDANVDELLLYSFSAIGCIALLVWVSGGLDSAYAQMYVLSMVYTCALHPPRRVLAYLIALVALVLLPLLYEEHVTRRALVELATELFVWLALAFVVIFLMSYVRAQRLGLRREGEQARRQARLDQLTGLLNRRAFDEDLKQSIERARAAGEPLSVLVGDLDDFKDFNDRFGHLEGDRVLQAVAGSLKAALRRPDIAYRWGGDEFAVILPQADLGGAEHVAARVESAVARASGPDGAALGISTGVAELSADDPSGPEALVERADQALMRAKGSGTFEIPQTHG